MVEEDMVTMATTLDMVTGKNIFHRNYFYIFYLILVNDLFFFYLHKLMSHLMIVCLLISNKFVIEIYPTFTELSYMYMYMVCLFLILSCNGLYTFIFQQPAFKVVMIIFYITISFVLCKWVICSALAANQFVFTLKVVKL